MYCWLTCEDYLIKLYRFGTFLCNCDKERHDLSLYARTPSLWAHLSAMSESFTNSSYVETHKVSILIIICVHMCDTCMFYTVTKFNSKGCYSCKIYVSSLQPIFPTSNIRRLRLWEEYFLRYDYTALIQWGGGSGGDHTDAADYLDTTIRVRLKYQ